MYASPISPASFRKVSQRRSGRRWAAAAAYSRGARTYGPPCIAALVYTDTVTNLLHILPDFLSLLQLVFHLFPCRKVPNYMDRIVIKSRVSACFIVLGLG
jgi:hypothetical protein